MFHEHIDVIATTVSGSIDDWRKIDRIAPLFEEHGATDVKVHVVDSHAEARQKANESLRAGGRIPISAGGSGTFKAVVQGCVDSEVPLNEIRLGFLRKGSADLIGKVLSMPDDIDEAVKTFVALLEQNSTVPCDLLRAESMGLEAPAQHFVGYGGAEIFGRIPHFTENRLMKWYKGVLSQVFGDLGPFTTGMSLALCERLVRNTFHKGRVWGIRVDGQEVAKERYQALIIVNGYLGPDLAYSDDRLGSGRFHLFGMRDQGVARLIGQARAARSGRITTEPEEWGLESFAITDTLELLPEGRKSFPANVDGSTLMCEMGLKVSRQGQLRLLGWS